MARTILVTGASSGFGALIARTQLAAGDTVFATMRNPAAAAPIQEFAQSAPGTLHVLPLDVTDDASVDAAVAEAGTLDVVVNNAGIGCGGLAETFTVAQFRQLFDVNVFGVQRVCRAALPAMRKAGSGLLVFVSSIMGRLVIPFSGPYTASKFALEGLAETYRHELQGTGVDVCIVEPGGFPTNIAANLVQAEDTFRLPSYGEIAELPDRMWGDVMEAMGGPEAPDSQLVADAVRQLIDGPRRLRTVVDPLMGGAGVDELNKTAGALQLGLLDNLGLG